MILVTRLVPYSAMALYPFILVKEEAMKQNAVLIHHEKIHHRQQLELLLVFFYSWYALNYLYNLLKYRNHYKAYKEIIFEREAFKNEEQANYLENRKLWAFLKYINHK